MEAKDLRIGNLIKYDGWHPDLASHNKPMPSYDVFVREIEYDEEKKCYIISSFNERAFEDSFEPIPLTEEWLRRFGFYEKYKSTSNRWLKWATNINAGLELHDCEDEEGNTHGVFLHDFVLEIKYIHELQNLYYALTKEELVLAVAP